MMKPTYLPAISMASVAFVFLNFGLPIRADDLGFSATAIGGTYAIFTGTVLLVRPVVGFCLDKFGRRWFFTAAFLFYVVAMTWFAFSHTLVDFYIARFLQGLGAATMWVSVRTMVAALYESETRGEAMGKLTTTSVRGSMYGAVFGFTLLGFLPMAYAWQWAFLGYAVMAAFALFWTLFKVRETQPQLSVAEGAEASQNAEQSAEQSTDHSSEFVLAPDLKRIFVIVFFTAFASALIEPIYLIYLRNKFEVGVQLLAFVFLPSGIVFAILPKYAGRWSDQWGRAPLIAIGVVFAGLVSILLPFWPNLWLVAVSYILFSVGWAMADPAIDAIVADLSDPRFRGRVMGLLEAFAGVGAACGPLVGGYLYDNWSAVAAFSSNGVILLMAAALTLFWFGRK